MKIKEVIEQEIKSNICNTILRVLPDWLGVDAQAAEPLQVSQPRSGRDNTRPRT